jgi:hypothetical protein
MRRVLYLVHGMIVLVLLLPLQAGTFPLVLSRLDPLITPGGCGWIGWVAQ